MLRTLAYFLVASFIITISLNLVETLPQHFLFCYFSIIVNALLIKFALDHTNCVKGYS